MLDVGTLRGMNLLSILRVVHIAAGATAFLVMPVPLVTKKGSRIHRLTGKVFSRAMMGVAATGIPLIISRISRNMQFGLFLIQIFVLTVMSVWFGLRALKAKPRTPERRFTAERIGAAVALAVSLAGSAFAAWRQVLVFGGFGALTSLLAFQWLRFFLRPYAEPQKWLLMHLMGMGTLAIAAVTAFAVTNANTLGVPHSLRWLVWLGPPVLGGVGIGIWQRVWRARFGTVAVAPPLA
jgi:uncharacterized membrane protein